MGTEPVGRSIVSITGSELSVPRCALRGGSSRVVLSFTGVLPAAPAGAPAPTGRQAVGAELVLQRAADREEKKEENDEPFVVGISDDGHGRVVAGLLLPYS